MRTHPDDDIFALAAQRRASALRHDENRRMYLDGCGGGVALCGFGALDMPALREHQKTCLACADAECKAANERFIAAAEEMKEAAAAVASTLAAFSGLLLDRMRQERGTGGT